jgi:hypothetical protein
VMQADLFSATPSIKDSLTPRLDPGEAPAGYFAMLKDDAKPGDGSNICKACDWRPACDAFSHRCMSYAVISARDGSVLQRRDGCSVVFKRKTSAGEEKTAPDPADSGRNGE